MTRIETLESELPEGGALCAVSGGLDSMCLLNLAVQWGKKQGRPVAAAHFNHQLRGADSDRDEAFVRDWCGARGIAFFAGCGDVRGHAARAGLSLEEAGRDLRYEFLETTRKTAGFGCVFTAHHAEDNAETMLLNLLRGTGLRGLCGIPAKRGYIERPLLNVTRAALAAYAEENGIPHVEDVTNETDDYTRNVLRHRVFPVLRECNPNAVENMSRAAALLAADAAALTQARDALLEHCEIIPGAAARLPLSELERVPEAVRSRAVLAALCAVGGHEKDLTAAHVRAVLELKQGQLSMPYGMTVLRQRDALRIVSEAGPPPEQTISVGEQISFGPWRVTLESAPGTRGIALSFPAAARLSVTVWHPHDRLNGRTVKRLCVDRGISPTERETLPVLRVDGAAAAIPILGSCETFAPDRHETAARVIFYKETEERDNDEQ